MTASFSRGTKRKVDLPVAGSSRGAPKALRSPHAFTTINLPSLLSSKSEPTLALPRNEFTTPQHLLDGLTDDVDLRTSPNHTDAGNSTASAEPSIWLQYVVMIYSLFFLGIPNFYIPSISVILDKVQRAEDDIHRLALVEGGGTTKEMILCDLDQSPDPWKVPHGYKDLQKSWHELVDNRTNEWVMLMTLSGMVFAGVVAFTQISGSSANPFMKNALQLSALCALTSIMGGAVYTFKFKAIRRTSMSIEWALDIRKSQGNVFWNTSLVLSLPAVWFVWSLLLCLTCILYYVLAPIPMDPEEYHSTFWHSLNIAGRVFVVGNLCSAVVQAFKVFYTFRRWRYDKLMSRLKEPPDPSSYISERLPSESSHPHFPPVQVDLENASSRRPNPSVPYSFDCTRLAGCRDAYTHGKSFMARVLPVAW